jgi:hypothetical protein
MPDHNRTYLPIVLAGLLVLPGWSGFAQEEGPAGEALAVAPPPSRGVLGAVLFDRNLNTYNWFGLAKVDSSWGDVSLRFSDHYTSNIILVEASGARPEQRLQSNRHALSAVPGFRLSNQVSLVGSWSTLVYSDAKAVGLSSASFNALQGGLEYAPWSWLALTPLAGYRWDNQGDFQDEGPSVDILAKTNPALDLSGYLLSSTLRYNRDDVDPRLLENHLVHAGMQKTFTGSTRDSLELRFSRNRREFYSVAAGTGGVSSDTTIEARIDDILSFANLLDYEPAQQWLMSFFIGVVDRNLDKDYRSFGTSGQSVPQFGTLIGEFSLSTFLQTMYRSADGETFVLGRFRYEERDETHAAKPQGDSSDPLYRQANETEKRKDNFSRRTELTGRLRFLLSRSDAVTIAGSAGILRYDTPHALNVEDRDEQMFTLGIGTAHSLGRYLDLGVNMSGSSSHTVYLFAERSANNYVNRILRLGPRVVYRPFERCSSINTFEVLANYTVYDFEEQAASVRSFSYRQFSWVDSTIVPITSRVSLDFHIYLRLYERGQLRWDEFTERPENAFTDETYLAQARFSPGSGLSFAAGARYFSQTRYSYNGSERVFDGRLKSFGPVCSIRWEPGKHSLLTFSGWYEERRQSDGAHKSLPNMTLNAQMTF